MIQRLSQIVEHSAQRAPNQEAFRCRTSSLSYQELNERSSQLAGLLQKFGVQHGDRVAIYMPKSLEMAISVFGCLKAGVIYVPIDPTLPNARLRYVMEDAGVAAILTSDRQRKPLESILPDLACTVNVIVGLPSADVATQTIAPTVPWDAVDSSCRFTSSVLTEDDPAYIIYTSGSTGHPKGILHTHRSGLAYARIAAETYQVCSSDRLGNFAPLHFDQSTFEYFAGPLVGATTVLIPEEHTRFPASLAKLIDDEQLTFWYSVPYALVQLLLRGALETRSLSSLRWVLYGGEPFPIGHLRALMQRIPAARFSNVYGPAEVNQCTYFNLPHPVGEDEVLFRSDSSNALRSTDANDAPPIDSWTSIPIGRVWQQTDWLIVDHNDQPVNQGDVGELLISGPTMMTRYWKRPELTAQVICEREHNDALRRFFRTGDLVRERDDGNLEFHGRSDRQVKIRGNRVELDEIEAVVLEATHVQQAAAFAVIDPATDDRRIVAAVILSKDTTTSGTEHIFAAARGRLPSYAVPAEVFVVESFPQTTSSKTDYLALAKQFERASIGGIA